MMTKNRRDFIGQLTLLAGIAAVSRPLSAIASVNKLNYNVNSPNDGAVIYHTGHLAGNLHAVYNGMGGLNHINAFMMKGKKAGLLFDAGNFLGKGQSQNQYLGIINTMNEMGYHAAVIGQHELANGTEHLANLAPQMQFALVNCNYNFSGILNKLVKPYIIVNNGDLKIGITGVGQQTKHAGYNDAITSVNRVAAHLKNIEKCDLVVCLSTLDHVVEGNNPDNLTLAKQSEHIDLIIGGQNAKLYNSPLVRLNKVKSDVVLSQSTGKGLMIGKTAFCFNDAKTKQLMDARYLIPGKAENETFSSAYQKLKAKYQAA